MSKPSQTPRLGGRLEQGSWDRAQNPTRHVSESLGIERWQLRQALHKIKARSNLRGDDRVIIYENGDVTDSHGNPIGNIYDEV